MRKAKWANWPYFKLNDDGMAACGFLGIFMTPKVPGSLSEVSHDSIKPSKIIAEEESNF